jgi:predicted nucleic acid-binding protein
MNLLLDTDILIDWLRGENWAKKLLLLSNIKFYYTSVNKKELLNLPSLRDKERKTIINLLIRLRFIKIDNKIAETATIFLNKYKKNNLKKEDALIAASAYVKDMPLITRNIKHYKFINEIKLNPRINIFP